MFMCRKSRHRRAPRLAVGDSRSLAMVAVMGPYCGAWRCQNATIVGARGGREPAGRSAGTGPSWLSWTDLQVYSVNESRCSGLCRDSTFGDQWNNLGIGRQGAPGEDNSS